MEKRILATLFVFAFLLCLVPGSPVQSQQPQPTTHDVLLLLPVPSLEQVPPGLAAADYTAEAAAPWLEQLEQLQAAGRVADFELLVEQHAIRITLWDDSAAPAELAGSAVVPATPENLACADRGAQAVRGVLHAALPAPIYPAARPQSNPSIYVDVSPSYSYMWGYTDPNVAVTMVLLDAAGQFKATQNTTSSSSGYYSFSPSYVSCFGYEYIVTAKDSVGVTAAGNTVSLYIAATTAFPDPATETVHGTTAANRRVDVATYGSNVSCTSDWQTTTTTSDAGGNYSAIFSPGFDRSTYATVYVYDANDNYFYSDYYVPQIQLATYYDNVYGYHWPNTAVTMALKRGGSTISSDQDMTDGYGYYYGYFTETVQAGDVVEVSGGSLTMSMTAVEVSSLTMDPAADRISGNIGTLGAGRQVKIRLSRTSYGCLEWDTGCLTVVADSSGNFLLDYTADGFDVMRGDRDYDPGIYDAEGNVQWIRSTLYVPVVVARVGGFEVTGYWTTLDADINVVLRAAGGAIKDVQPETTSASNASINEWFAVSAVAGDSVEVGDGTYTMTVLLPDLTAYLDLTTDMVNGNAPASSTVYLRLSGSFPDYHYACTQTVALAGNTYASDLNGTGIAAGDSVYTYYPAADGHWARVYSHATAINAHKEGAEVDGFVPLAGVSVTVTLERAGGTVDSFTATASDGRTAGEGSYTGQFPSATIQEGDNVWASIDGHDPVILAIPPLTMNEDVPGNRLYGQTAPDAPVEGALLYGYSEYSLYGQSDAGGNYSFDFAGLYDWNCDPVSVGGCSQSRVTYYSPAAHTVWLAGPEPPDVSADAYEPDNDYTSATPYSGVQDHSFHVYTDTDWTSFTVGPADVGRTYFLATVNLGADVDTYLDLYDTDGTTRLASDDDGGPGWASLIVWTAPATGTYYLNVWPLGSGSTTVCGSVYTLIIQPYQTYLPLVFH